MKKKLQEADPNVQLYNKASKLYENLFIDKEKFYHVSHDEEEGKCINQLEAFFIKYNKNLSQEDIQLRQL